MGNPYASAAAAVDPGFSIGYGNNYTLERNTRTASRLVYGACSILLRLITLSMQVTPIEAREHLLIFWIYIRLHVRAQIWR